MMSPLGNSRRGARAPTLLLAALIACVLLLAFNHWVSSARNVELQSRILGLEERLRVLSADRDRELQSKLNAEEELHRQSEQLELMETQQRRHQDIALSAWKKERESLKLNISTSGKSMLDMKSRMRSLQEDVSKLQQQLRSCQSDMDALSEKASQELNLCNKQMAAVREECGKNNLPAKQEVPKDLLPVAQKSADAPVQKDAVLEANPELSDTELKSKPITDAPSQQKDVKDVVLGEAGILEPADVELEDAGELEDLKVKATKEKDQDGKDEEAFYVDEKDKNPGIGDLKDEDATNNEDAVMYDNEREIEKQLSKIEDVNPDPDLDEDVMNYNGDDDNQPESEDEKQAELAAA